MTARCEVEPACGFCGVELITHRRDSLHWNAVDKNIDCIPISGPTSFCGKLNQIGPGATDIHSAGNASQSLNKTNLRSARSSPVIERAPVGSDASSATPEGPR